jgi:hypothetical protein
MSPFTRKKRGPLVPTKIHDLRESIPAASYMHLLHQGAMTGFIPRFTPEGEPTGEFDALNPHDRVDIARYLIDKIIPDAPKELALVAPALPADAAVTVEALRNMPTEELLRLATTPSTPDETPAHGCPITVVAAPLPAPSPAGTSAA